MEFGLVAHKILEEGRCSIVQLLIVCGDVGVRIIIRKVLALEGRLLRT